MSEFETLRNEFSYLDVGAKDMTEQEFTNLSQGELDQLIKNVKNFSVKGRLRMIYNQAHSQGWKLSLT